MREIIDSSLNYFSIPLLFSCLIDCFYLLQGCTVKLLEVLNSYAKTFIGVWLAIGLAQLLGLFFSLVLCCALHQNSYKS